MIVLRGQTVCKDEPIISTNDDADIDDEDDEVDNRSDNNGDKIDGSIEPRTRSQSLSAASDSILIESEVSVLKAKSEKSRFRPQSVDIFSLGCVFHYVISCGLHPFGLWYEREANIVQGKPNLSVLSSLPDALDLVRRMTSNDPKTRPSAKQVCHHPFFWTFQRRLDFFIQLSDRLELLPADAPAVLHIESDALALLGRGWDRKFDSRLLEDMGRYRKYDSCSVRDLLRVIRNKRNHYNELSDEMKDVTGDLPAGFLSYFETRFPKLLMHCVQVCCTHYSDPNVEKELGPYCLHIASLFRSPAVTMNSASAIASIRSVHGSINTVSTNISLKSQDFGVNDSRYESISDSVALRTNSAVIEEGDAKENMTIVSPDVSDLVVWWGGALAETCNVRGWWRDDVHWITQPGLNKIAKQRPSHIARSATDSKYRSRLCTHWELTQECAFRKKGKCDFAHYPIELRIKDTRRDKWNAALQQKQQHGKLIIPSIADTSVDWLKSSGGEDVLSAARSIEKVIILLYI